MLLTCICYLKCCRQQDEQKNEIADNHLSMQAFKKQNMKKDAILKRKQKEKQEKNEGEKQKIKKEETEVIEEASKMNN